MTVIKKSMAKLCLFSGLLILSAASSVTWAATSWTMFGQNVSNTAVSPDTTISTSNVGALAPKWVATVGGDVSARAAVDGDYVFVPDWAGNIWALDAKTGKTIWSHQFSDYGLAAGTVSHNTPVIGPSGIIYVGTQFNQAACNNQGTCSTGWLLAINGKTGALVWKMQPDSSNAFPVITSSPVLADDVLYFGMTSDEEFVAVDPSYPCCSARGSVVAVRASTGAKLWQTFTVPSGDSGGASWGSNPIFDSKRHTLYVGTGNNYSVPTDSYYVNCINNGGTPPNCLSPDDHVDSILALDPSTGAIKWSTRLVNWNQQQTEGVANGTDEWNVACFVPPYTNCPASAGPGPDYDFGSSPNEITYQSGNSSKTIIGAGQKSGIYYALDPDTGSVLWNTQVGPGSSLGGVEWGSASDGTNIYVAISNYYGIPYSAGYAGSWAALNPATGAIIWQVADPNGSIDLGAVTAANGVVYAASMGGSANMNTMFALSASSGTMLWSYPAGSSVIAGASIANGTVYWGSGYSHLGIPGFTGNNKFYAFSLGGQ